MVALQLGLVLLAAIAVLVFLGWLFGTVDLPSPLREVLGHGERDDPADATPTLIDEDWNAQMEAYERELDAAVDEAERVIAAIAVFTDTDRELADLEDELRDQALRDPDVDVELAVEALLGVGRARTALRRARDKMVGSEDE